MGFCNRCGDIINNSKCRKCGGKPVESIAKGAVDSKVSIVDRWQNQYANSILSEPDSIGIATSTIGKRSSVANFTSSYRTKPSSPDIQSKNWFLSQKSVPHGTQLGKNDSYARPRLDSRLFEQYKKSVNQQPEPSSPPTTGTTHISSIRPLASQSSSPSLSSYMDKPRMSMSSSTSTTTTSTALPKLQLKQRHSTHTSDKPSSSNKKTCRKCMQVLRGPRVRLPSPNGDTWYYHYDCLTCAACGDHFTESEFVGDGKDVFHLHCRSPSPASSTPPPLSPTTSSSPDLISPSTSPIPTTSTSSTTTTTPSYLRSRRLSSTQPQPLDYRCHTCSLPIQDKCLKNGTRFFHPNCFTCYSCREHLPSDRPFYDIQQEAHCEICTQLIIKKGSSGTTTTSNNNNSNSVSDRRRSMPGDNFYGPTPIHTSSTGLASSISSPLSPSTSSPLVATARSGDNGESRIWMNRTRALPKLGGSKICPGCHKSIGVMDESPGPKGSKWHKKCLRCTGCKKQMDSSAKLLEMNEKLAVRCSDCSDKRVKPHYVR